LGTTSSTLHVALETIIPDRTIADDLDDDEEEDTVLHHKAPSRVEAVSFSVTPTTVHWVKQTEHFPVPTESIIRLPTGKPVSIPKIQHGFSDESNIAKVKREGRQQKVKDEFKRAWNGYKKKAWMHDEIKPVSGEFKDPFNGWAATLVDALDTIYIMGLETEFEEAVQAVGKIDFTTSIRGDIPVFETTIRYLGGLIGAYDISGHKHQILLGKAVELAEVLMGVFDTPNRMPVLNYYWKPDYASQPHRASMRANMAELGSLAMEFTRLAQLTEKPKYYDAVARITNALVEWQERGAPMKGLFPEMIDASGCNRTAVPIPEHVELELAQDDDEVVGYVPPMPETVPEKKPEKKGVPAGSRALEMHVAPAAPGQPERASLNEIIVGDDKKPKTQPGKEQRKKIGKRADAGSAAAQVTPKTIPQSSGNQTSTRVPPAAQIQTGRMEATKTQEEGDGCVEQGLTSGTYGTDQYSMGAGQDSTYEYFAKQWLLLGGLEPKYKKLYLETVDAVRRHMLYRPMVPGDRDILFSGKLYVSDGKIKRFEAEATHLTCFLGGMIGMGSRIFDIPEDLEIAKRLTDGCVWAYEATQTGIMPETAEVVKCEKVNDCHWNETLWYQKLDPLYADREGMIGDYEINKAKMKAQAEADRLAAEAKAKAEAEAKAKAEAEQARLDAEADQDGEHEREHESSKQGLDGNDGSKSPAPAERKDDDENKMDAGTSKTALRKRTPPPKGDGSNPNISQERLRQKMKDTEVELDGVAPGREIDKPSFYVPEASAPGERVFDPERPPTHKEWVEQKLERENLPPGYLRMWGMYILR
jgi:mannosyl-oligosaccharide alpha-1,2-mannosidase